MVRPTVEQEAIFSAVAEGGWTAVNAVAGSGKTTTATAAAKGARQHGRRIFCAFNRHNAADLENRLPIGWEAATLHRLGREILAQHTRRKLTVRNDKYRSLAWDYIRDDNTTWRHVYATQGECVDDLVDAVNACRLTYTDPLDDTALTVMLDRYALGLPDCMRIPLRQIVRAGWSAWQKSGLIDFTDMLWIPVADEQEVFATASFLGIDEAQDLSDVQIRLLRRIIRATADGIIVGDPAQAIQGFAFADWQSFDRVKSAFSVERELPLSVNWRCPASHIELARELVPHIQARPGAPAGTVVRGVDPLKFVHEHLGNGDVRIICRNNAPLIKVCAELINRGVAARIRGVEFGEALAKTVKQAVKMRPSVTYCDFLAAVDDWREKESERLGRRRNGKAQIARIEAISDCITVGYATSGASDFHGLLSFFVSIFEDGKADVWLSSVHRAKGMEADHVIILEPSRLGAYAYPRATDDEKKQEDNIHYVALTRAKKTLAFA